MSLAYEKCSQTYRFDVPNKELFGLCHGCFLCPSLHSLITPFKPDDIGMKDEDSYMLKSFDLYNPSYYIHTLYNIETSELYNPRT